MAFVYTLTSILSAFLVFLIQPVVAKIALPTLGGTPAVWNGCMVFFQAMLLMGYSYAHFLGARVNIKQQPFIHLALMVVAIFTFPLVFDGPADIDPAYSPLTWLLIMLFYSVGLPFFVICATSPLLQKWFAATDHKDAANPYFLYAASNIGSMGALFLYPVAIEPFLPLLGQVRVWEKGIIALFVLFIGVAVLLRKRLRADAAGAKAAIQHIDEAPVDKARRLNWVLLSFVPSSLLYGVTAYITTDIASAPMLWVIPLALYLITFILVFEKNLRGFALASRLHFPFVMIVILIISLPIQALTIFLLLHLLTFFIVTMTLHGLLSKSKPTPAHLTEFFLWMSFGGVLGGIFNTLVAPFIFNSIAEYPLALILSCVLRGSYADGMAQLRRNGWKILVAAIVLTGGAHLLWGMYGGTGGSGITGQMSHGGHVLWISFILVVTVSCLVIGMRYDKTPALFGLGLALVAIGSTVAFAEMMGGHKLFQERSIFGVNKVTKVGDEVHIFMHGTTMHGVQLLDESRRLKPVSYYTQLIEVFNKLDSSAADKPVALLGLGAGTIACYGKKGQLFDLYEIDPLVVKIAKDERFFTYMRDCPPEKEIILGDARLKIQMQPEKKYGLMIMDAFSSDSIPVHLITKEAVEMYKSKLDEKGLIAFHISNRHIELRPVLAAIVEATGLKAIYRTGERGDPKQWIMGSLWVVLAPDAALLEPLLAQDTGWNKLPAADSRYLWTDDFSNILFSLHAFSKFKDPVAEAAKAAKEAKEAKDAAEAPKGEEAVKDGHAEENAADEKPEAAPAE